MAPLCQTTQHQLPLSTARRARSRPAAAPPPAAVVVVEGTKTEREIQLEKDLRPNARPGAKPKRMPLRSRQTRHLKEIPVFTPPNPKRSRNTFSMYPED